MPDEPLQKRRFPRYKTAVAVTVYQGGTVCQAQIVNISRGGCLIFPPLPPAENPELRLSFCLPDGSTYINCKGEVVYSISDKGTGVAFREISIYNQDRITEFFEKRLAPEKSAG